MKVFDFSLGLNPSLFVFHVLFVGITHKIAKNTVLQSPPQKVVPLPDHEKIVWNRKKVDADAYEPSGPENGGGFKTELKPPDQLLKSISLAKFCLEETNFTLSQVGDLIFRTKKIVKSMRVKVHNYKTHGLVAGEVEKLWGGILERLNPQDLGIYAMAGKQNGIPPFRKEGKEVAYQRNAEDIELEVEPGLNMRINLLSSDFLTKPLKTLGEDFDLDPGINQDTRLSDLNRGRGVNLGSIKIMDSNASKSRDINLHHATTIGEVIDAINSCGITDLIADISASKKGLKMTYTRSNQSNLEQGFTVSETRGTTARDLGILTNLLKPSANQPGSLEGKDLDPILTQDMPVSLLKRGKGLALGSIKIVLGKPQKIVDLSSASNVREIIGAINNSMPEVIASINNSKKGISVESTVARKSLAIYDADGKKNATSLGISGSPDIWGCFLFLMEALRNDDRESISKSLEILNLSSPEILTYKQEIETKLKILESKRCRIIGFQSDATRLLPGVRGADLFQAAKELVKQQSIYQSALQSGMAMIQPGLLNFIK
jgi:hypothetical protein